MIYLINWTLMPKMAAEDGKRKSLITLCCVYALSLFVGAGYILWQYTILPKIFTVSMAQAMLLPTFGINLPIVLIACPALIRAISPKLRTWGMYCGNFREWRSLRAKSQVK
jgi:hypothetical protein